MRTPDACYPGFIKIQPQWFAPEGAQEEKNYYFRARKKIVCKQATQKSCCLYIAAESYYVLYLNGQVIGRGPARGTHGCNFYDTYDLAGRLHLGENYLAVECHCLNYDTFIAAPAQPALSIKLDGEPVADATWQVQKALDWRQDTMIYSMQVGACEWRDLRQEPQGWLTFEDESNWVEASVIPTANAIYSKNFVPRDIPSLEKTCHAPTDIPLIANVDAADCACDINIARQMTEEAHSNAPAELIRQMENLLLCSSSPVIIQPTQQQSGLAVIFDFAKEIVGRFELEIDAPSGTIVDVCHEEELWNGRLRADHKEAHYNFADRYILRSGKQRIGNTLTDRGFRMVQIVIRNFSSPVKIHTVRAVNARYPYTSRASFFCSDPLLNRIWDVATETLRACTTDVFIDCPWRERSFWVNDMVVENRTTLQAFGDARVSARAFRLAFSDCDADGLVPGVCPAPDDKRSKFTLLPTNLYITRMLKDYFLYSGDKELVKDILPRLTTIIEVFSRWMDESGLICPPDKYWNFFDWSYGLNGIDYNGRSTSLLNLFYINALHDLIELSSLTNMKIDEPRYRKLISKARLGVKQFLRYDNRIADCLSETGEPGPASQLAHALAFLCGEFTDDIVEGISDPSLLVPEFYFHLFVLEALSKNGKSEEALARIRKYWGPNIMTGTPTIWEADIHGHGKKAFHEAGSLCHGFATAPIDFFQTVILGVRPLAPGFKQFMVDPQPCGLDFASGRIPVPGGNIEINWKKQNEKMSMSLRVPEGLTAYVGEISYGPGRHDIEIAHMAEVAY